MKTQEIKRTAQAAILLSSITSELAGALEGYRNTIETWGDLFRHAGEEQYDNLNKVYRMMLRSEIKGKIARKKIQAALSAVMPVKVVNRGGVLAYLTARECLQFWEAYNAHAYGADPILTKVVTGGPAQRVYRVFAMLARSRKTMRIKFTHKWVADYCGDGVSTRTLTRALDELEAAGLVKVIEKGYNIKGRKKQPSLVELPQISRGNPVSAKSGLVNPAKFGVVNPAKNGVLMY